jgi:hypothetical protein
LGTNIASLWDFFNVISSLFGLEELFLVAAEDLCSCSFQESMAWESLAGECPLTCCWNVALFIENVARKDSGAGFFFWRQNTFLSK